MSENWAAVVMTLLGASLALNFMLGLFVFKVVQFEERRKDETHKFPRI